MLINTIHNIDAKEGYKLLEDKSINTIVTSPPYYGLRDYGVNGQIGLEETPEMYVNNLVEIFRNLRTKLRDDGTLWLNLGDSYSGSQKGEGGTYELSRKQNSNRGSHYGKDNEVKTKFKTGLKPKDLIGIPWMVAFALRSDGWYLRQDIIWHKPNPMPESVTDRCTKAHEYIFLLSKSGKYYYDNESIKEDSETFDITVRDRENSKLNNTPGRTKMGGLVLNNYNTRNKRSVWTVTTKPFTEAHFATYPEELIKDCILAGCPEGGIVLDPFMGAGTTALVSKKYGRNYIGFELNPEYVNIAENRLMKELGIFYKNDM